MAKYSAFAASADARYAHISPEQKAEVAAACASAQEWMEERRGEADAGGIFRARAEVALEEGRRRARDHEHHAVLCLVFGPNLFFLLEGTFQRAFELHNHGDELERYA